METSAGRLAPGRRWGRLGAQPGLPGPSQPRASRLGHRQPEGFLGVSALRVLRKTLWRAGGVLRVPGPSRALWPPLQGSWWEPAAACAPRSGSGPFAFVRCGSDRGYRHRLNFLSPFYAVISVLLNICRRRTRAL